MIIRLATARDLDQMAELWDELMQYHAPLHGTFELVKDARRIARQELTMRMRHPHVRFFVCDMGEGRLAGMIATQYHYASPAQMRDYHGYIAETVVRHDCRGQGIGARLVNAACQWLTALGVDYIELQVAPGNPQGVVFWKEQGFEVLTYHMVKTTGKDSET